MSKFRAKKSLFQIAFLFSLLSCGSTPVHDGPQKEEATAIPITIDGISELLEHADQQDRDQRYFIYLDVTQALIEANEIDWARNTIAQLSPYRAPSDQLIRYAVLDASIAIAQGDMYSARRMLWDERLENASRLAPAQEVDKLLEMRARYLFSVGDYHGSVAQRIALYQQLNDPNSERYKENHELIWQTLMELPYSDLHTESQIQNAMLEKGWYTLAALSKNNQTNIRQQVTELRQWALNWPAHPASLQVPADLQLLRQLAEEQPTQIALLLPFNGRFAAPAEAIRDGIMAAYYDASTYETHLPDLRVYDTSTTDDINTLYDEAVLQGAKLIIGPLEQDRIVELALRPELPVPTLALNRINTEFETPSGLFQFGLPPEDEAEQVAQQAWRDGHRRAMVLASQSKTGDRAVKAFTEKWLSLGGELINDYRYQEQNSYLNLIKDAVKVEASEQRKRRIQSLIGQRVEFEPRRRKDVDFIFLYSQASQARQIKPLLAFNYAGDVPVYAIKDIYNGTTDRKRDKDLNNIQFTTLPWFFEDNLPEKQAIDTYSRGANYQILYALGVDAYHIHPRLRQLIEVKQASFYGTTGKLSVNSKQQIKREQVWAKFENGMVISTANYSGDDDL